MGREDIICEVLEAVDEFNRRKLWKRFTNFDCFGVRIAGRACPEQSRGDELMLGVVLGNAGEEFGLSLFRGPNAADAFAALLASDGPGDDALEETDMLGFSMEAFGNLLPDAQGLLREAGRRPRFDEQVPHLLAKPPGRRARLPDESELTFLVLTLRAVIQADKKKLLQPASLEDECGICVLTVCDTTAAGVTVTREHWQQQEGSKTIPLLRERLDLSDLPYLDATWLVGMPTIPGAIQDDDRTIQMVLVVDEESEYVFQGKPVLGGDLREAAKIVMATFRGGGMGGQTGLPRKIIFSSRKLFDAMVPILEPAGVTCVYEPIVPMLQAILADLIEHLDSSLPSFVENREAGNEPEAEIPSLDDLKGWKEADLRLARRFSEHFQFGRPLWSNRAVKRYFNEDEDLEFYLTDPRQRGIVPAYTAWGVLDYRPNKTSKTHAEKMLTKGLPEAILLRARMKACPTLYRVADHDPKAGTIGLEDVLLGATVTVNDQLMSENIENNLFFAARAFPVGRFHFVEPAGPLLGAIMGLEAVEFLRGCGMELSPEGLRRDAHKFGWLWRWIDKWEAKRKSARLCNTDGDELVWHTASFSIADPVSTRQRLLQRQDIQYDEHEDDFIWIKQSGRGARMLGGPVTMGRIEFVGDELVLTVNSAKRLATARQWLEELPGVAFLNVKTRQWDERDEDRPMDERISKPEPVEITPELEATLQGMMDKHYMEWIDMPLPVLDGKTPRQACRTKAGRQQVTMLIRTMPDPVGRGSVRAPRAAMLRELGLATESSSSPEVGRPATRPPIPIETITPRPKVPRNAPCPLFA